MPRVKPAGPGKSAATWRPSCGCAGRAEQASLHFGLILEVLSRPGQAAGRNHDLDSDGLAAAEQVMGGVLASHLPGGTGLRLAVERHAGQPPHSVRRAAWLMRRKKFGQRAQARRILA